MNSSGLFEEKSQHIRWRSNSHSTFLSALCQGEESNEWNKQMMHLLFTCTAKWIWNFTISGQTFLWVLCWHVTRFVHVLVLLVVNTGCPKKLLKMGNTAMLFSSSNYAKKPYECVHRRRFVFLVFSNFSETPCMKVDFDVRISPCLMNEGRFPQVGDSIFFCLPRLYLYLRGAAF